MYQIHNIQPLNQGKKATLFFEREEIVPEDNPTTYVGITFDKRLTWKPQIQKIETKAKVRLTQDEKDCGLNMGSRSLNP